MATLAKQSIDLSDHKHQFEPMPDIDEDLKYEVPPLNIDPNETSMGDEARKRRFSVSAEASDDKKEKFIKKMYPKSKEALNRIKQSVSDVFLFEGIAHLPCPVPHVQGFQKQKQQRRETFS